MLRVRDKLHVDKHANYTFLLAGDVELNFHWREHYRPREETHQRLSVYTS